MRKTKSKKSKKPLTLNQLKAKLDKAFSEKVRARGHCERCGNQHTLQCAHIFSRSHMNTRWDEDNALCFCLRCHMYWAHRCPVEFTEWVQIYLGGFQFNELRIKANTLRFWERWEMEELLK